ncbi:MAG: patatin-like phospholipase family protein [Myxococcota bacterium]|nr:patatin-like phospholipase family protein [Myxococcota bacterium]
MSPTAEGKRPKRAIVLSGGGARGAYEAGVLRFILDELPRRRKIEPHFDIICGTSVGAIHAAFVAATANEPGERGPQLVGIWEGLHVEEVFKFSTRDLVSMPARLFSLRRVAKQLREGRRPDRLFGLLDTAPLERLVLESIPWDGIRQNISSGRVEALCVAATQLATGRAIVFCERKERKSPSGWLADDSIRVQPTRIQPVHALASAAIPLLFPSVRVGARYYAAGGLRLNTPLAPAVRLGADRILVIGLSHVREGETPEYLAQQRAAGFGNPFFLFGKVLNALMLSPVDADLARVRLINHIIDHGTAAFGSDFLERLNETAVHAGGRGLKYIQDMVIRPSQDLGLMAGKLLAENPDQFKLNAFLKLFIKASDEQSVDKEADLLSYLLFDTAFTAPLAELGYADAAAREDELAEFFTDPGAAPL